MSVTLICTFNISNVLFSFSPLNEFISFFSDKKGKQPKKKCVISSEARTHEHLASLELYGMYCNNIMIYYLRGLTNGYFIDSIDQPNRSTGYVNFQLNKTDHLTLKMATAEIVERSVASNSASQYCSHQVIIFNQGMLLLGSTHFLGDVVKLTGAISLLLVFFIFALICIN